MKVPDMRFREKLKKELHVLPEAELPTTSSKTIKLILNSTLNEKKI